MKTSITTAHSYARFNVLPLSVLLFWLNFGLEPSWSNAASDAAFQTGANLIQKRKPRLAISHLSRAIQLDPSNGAAFLERAQAHLMLDQPKNTVEDASVAIRLIKDKSDLCRAYELRAKGQLEHSKYAEAKGDFTKSIQLTNDTSRTWILYEFRAKTCLLLDDYKSAYEDLTKSIKAAPTGNYGPYFHRGNILLKWRKYKEAIDDYTNSLKYRPQDENIERIYTERARAYEAIGRKDLAAKDRQRVRQGDKDWELYLEDSSTRK